MKAKQEPLFEIPPASPAPGSWVCGRCGNDNPSTVRLDAGGESVDPRYGTGTCDDCAKPKKGHARQRVTLVAASSWNRARFLAAKGEK